MGFALADLERKKRRPRRIWVKEWIKNRQTKGAYNALLNEFLLTDREDYRRFMRMNTETFSELLERIRPYITGTRTVMREPISVEEKLAVTLRFLGTGEDFVSLSYLFRIHSTTISKFVPIVCHYIYHVLKHDYMQFSSAEDDWLRIAQKNYQYWQFPNALAAVDGKHMAIKCPSNGGSEYWCYKGFHSIVLMALVTHDYKFLYADVGCQGRISDGGVWSHCSFAKKLNNRDLNLPTPRILPKPNDPVWHPHMTGEKIPFVIIGDSAFPLQENIMKPYPEKGMDDKKRIFNYRLSRFRRVSENAFGILVNRFRMFGKRIDLEHDIVKLLTTATIALHNMLCTKSRDSYSPSGFVDEFTDDGELNEGLWRQNNVPSTIIPLEPRKRANKAKWDAENIRDNFANYFFGQGQVTWQWKTIV